MAQDPYKYFRIEAGELLDQLGKGVLDLEKGSPLPEHVPRLLRLAHTLKGAARVVRQREIADLAHAIEDTLTVFRESVTALPRDRVDSLLQVLDAIQGHVTALGAPVAVAAEAAVAPEEIFRTVRADIEEMDALIEGVSEAHIQLAGLRQGSETLGRLRNMAEMLVEQLRSPRVQRSGGRELLRSLSTAEEVSGLLDTLGNSFSVGIGQIDRELRQVRAGAERLRLLPVGLMFNVLERTARDAAQSLGKEVVFEAGGGDVRLDAHVLGIMQNALVQIVRNAVAHGIESPGERRSAGKAPAGRLVLDVVRHGGRVSFICRDDGQGVDVEAVRRAVERRGVRSAETSRLGPEELIHLLLKGGISTSGTVTEVSGRGIGLDVVRDAAGSLGGDVTVRTAVRQGTTFEVRVPVSLVSLDALLVEAGDQAVVIPLDAVRRTLHLRAADVAHTPEGETIVIGGRVVPFTLLARTLRMRGVVAEATMSRRTWSAVVVESGGALAAIGVDRLLGTKNVVLRPLPRLMPADPVVAGASFDAEGNPQLVLDPEVLVAEARRVRPAGSAAPVQRLPILVVDDSLTTRMLEQSILESAGYEVDLATSGEEGMAKARQRRYALFLVDVEMPGMDGFEFVERICADPDLRDIPAILVTSRNAPEDRQRGADAGARAYIVKSDFDQAELLERIRRLVE